MAIRHYYLGCPIWSYKGWAGSLFRTDARAADFLGQYASVFNTVEGNTTFYAVPSAETVARWRAETPDDFRFCFKFPRTITHDRRLQGAEGETRAFLERMAPLGRRLGPFLLQLPPSFGPEQLPLLEAYLDHLPAAYEYVAEVRHLAFFSEGEAEQKLNELLASRNIDRAIFDTRALRQADAGEAAVRAAQRRKPDLPTRFFATGQRPLFRYVGHPQTRANLPYLRELADAVAAWIGQDLTPFVYIHNPYDDLVPSLARVFHRLLGEHLDVGEMPAWPGESETPPAEQLSLF